eukprot:8373438-Lingulodinium_polyedra.AAC.1
MVWPALLEPALGASNFHEALATQHDDLAKAGVAPTGNAKSEEVEAYECLVRGHAPEVAVLRQNDLTGVGILLGVWDPLL